MGRGIQCSIQNTILLYKVWCKMKIADSKDSEYIEDGIIRLVLFVANMIKEIDFNIEWKKFYNEISQVNRFNIKSEIVNDIVKEIKESETYLPKGSILYRARKCRDHKLISMFNWDETIKEKIFLPFTALLTENEGDIQSIMKNEELQKILNTFMEHKKSNFWGYSKKHSGPPTADKIKDGRANPQGIVYLYTAESPDTALAEIRPTISERISIATVKMRKRLKLADFTVMKNKNSLVSLSTNFSSAALGDSKDYLPMQYIAEKIKLIGFDGIRYASSLHENGHNVVIFNPKNCEVISSELHQVSKIRYESSKVLPIDSELEDIITSAYSGNYEPLIKAGVTTKKSIKEYFDSGRSQALNAKTDEDHLPG